MTKKQKTIILVVLLFIIPFVVSAGICFPKQAIYVNNNGTEKVLPCNSFLNKLTARPLETQTFQKHAFSYTSDSSFGCKGKDTTTMSSLTFQDFSLTDKIKILINSILMVIIYLLPIGLFIVAYRKTKSLYVHIFLDVLLIFGYIPWLLFLIPYFFEFC